MIDEARPETQSCEERRTQEVVGERAVHGGLSEPGQAACRAQQRAAQDKPRAKVADEAGCHECAEHGAYAEREIGQAGLHGRVAQYLLHVAQLGAPTGLGVALHAHARLGLAEDPGATLAESIDHLRHSPAHLELARALMTQGSQLRREGQRTRSREPLREGYELATRCGALALAESARAELRASGIRLRRETLSGPAALTPSERRIAEMASAGASNHEIAQALFLSVKTIEMHLTHA
ncbi:MAG: helix-turn-helix transcriptional regulator [Actinomycetota bacterium]|nr:helix-turn-helix transcriptional regulator [Actinomycetota bacterium]